MTRDKHLCLDQIVSHWIRGAQMGQVENLNFICDADCMILSSWLDKHRNRKEEACRHTSSSLLDVSGFALSSNIKLHFTLKTRLSYLSIFSIDREMC